MLSRRQVILVLQFVIALLWTPETSEPQTFVFEQGADGYFGFDDTTIFSESDNSGGGTPGVYSGTILNLEFDGSRQHRRALIRCDLSSIPPDWIVEEVNLRLTIQKSGGNFGDIDYGLHRVTAAWGEGTVVGLSEGGFGATAHDGDATWRSRRHNISPWDTPGGDYYSAPSALSPAGRANTMTNWSSPGLVQDVQEWISNPTSNRGWIAISALEGTRHRVKKFYSSESDSDRPRLVVVARAPAQNARHTAYLVILAIIGKLLLRIRSFRN
ncbi:MAG: DNRLRE domain-containing protein [Candidatus Hydrogenedentota bacterium]